MERSQQILELWTNGIFEGAWIWMDPALLHKCWCVDERHCVRRMCEIVNREKQWQRQGLTSVNEWHGKIAKVTEVVERFIRLVVSCTKQNSIYSLSSCLEHTLLELESSSFLVGPKALSLTSQTKSEQTSMEAGRADGTSNWAFGNLYLGYIFCQHFDGYSAGVTMVG